MDKVNEIWIVSSGCYSDVMDHGFFLTEQDAKEYCDWVNQYQSGDWNRYYYHRLKHINIAKEKKQKKPMYEIHIEKDFVVDVENIHTELFDYDRENQYCMYYYEEGELFSGEEDWNMTFQIQTDNKEKALKITYDLIAQLKEKYAECEDWQMTIESIGGSFF